MSAARLIVERNRLLTERVDQAFTFGALEWIAATVEEKEHLLAVLKELARERAVSSDAETVGRLYAALDLLDAETVDLASLAAVIRGTIRQLGGHA